MRIGELARRVGVSPKTIRYYEAIGLLPEPRRTASGYRDYEPTAADQLFFIRGAKRLGIGLDDVREVLAFQERGEAPCSYVREVIDARLDSIDRRIAELQTLRTQLSQLSAEARRLPTDSAGSCRLIEHATGRCGS